VRDSKETKTSVRDSKEAETSGSEKRKGCEDEGKQEKLLHVDMGRQDVRELWSVNSLSDDALQSLYNVVVQSAKRRKHELGPVSQEDFCSGAGLHRLVI